MGNKVDRNIPLMIILSSPSGAGKSSIARELMAQQRNIGFSVSATTRPPRPGEEDGVHYHFVSKDEFKQMVADNQMLEYAEVFGNYYGTPRQPVEKALADGQDVIFDVDWQGGQQLRNCPLKSHIVSVFVLPPSITELHERLNTRAQDSAEVIENRMRKSRDEISHWEEYDYLIINRDINRSVAELSSILMAERLRRQRWDGAINFVQQLNAEFEEIWSK